MDKFEIIGGNKISGTVAASGSKNAALPILFGSILTEKPLQFSRVPRLKDIETTLQLLQGVGAEFTWKQDQLSVHIPKITSSEAPYELVRTMRASTLMLGPLLARVGKAKVSLPGGCAIGSRPVDLHLLGLEKMGATIQLEQGYIVAETAGRLKGAVIEFRAPSVGATENLMMAATLAQGKTVLKNAAREPEIIDLAKFLRTLGAKISGDGSEDIEIEGVESLHGGSHEIMFDRIEAATLLLAGPMTGGCVRVTRSSPKYLESFLQKLKESGVKVRVGDDWMEAEANGVHGGVEVTTEPFPGFPTDLQAQLMAYLAQVGGTSTVTEKIFENRFMHVPELNRLGARIDVQEHTAIVHGKPNCYQGATVMATDLRASASLVLAALSARGKTTIRRIYHLDRGYEELEKKLNSLGAQVLRSRE